MGEDPCPWRHHDRASRIGGNGKENPLAAALKLVNDYAPRARKKPKRRLQVRYYKLAGTMPDYPDAYGHPRTEVGLLRGAMVHLFMGKYELARVYDVRTGRFVMSLQPRPNGLPVARFGPHVLGVVNPRTGTITYNED